MINEWIFIVKSNKRGYGFSLFLSSCNFGWLVLLFSSKVPKYGYFPLRCKKPRTIY